MVTKQKILIVDDDENIAELISLYLTKECFETKIVYDGESALDALPSFKPNLILLDLMLPGIDGYQVCRELRSRSNTPIIMLSAKGETFDKVLGLELGADFLQLLAGLVHGIIAAFVHDCSMAGQSFAIVRVIAQDVHAVFPPIIIGRQLHRRDQLHTVLLRVGVSITHRAVGIMVADGKPIQPRAGRQPRQLFDEGRTVRTGRMGMQITGHRLSSSFPAEALLYTFFIFLKRGI